MPPMAHFSNPSEDLTTMWCDTRRLTKIHISSQHQRLYNTTASSPNCHQDSAKARVKEWKYQQLWPTMTLGWIGLTQISRVRHRWYLRYPEWLLQLFADCLVCSGYCLQLLCVFLECVLLPCAYACACACFWHLGLKTHLANKTLNKKPL
jgi:hypothetical protein